MEIEEAKDKLMQFIKDERKSRETERMMVADLLDTVLEDNGQADLMVSSLNQLIDAATSAIGFIEELLPPETLSEDEKARGLKRYRVEYSIEFSTGVVDITAPSPIVAADEVREGWGDRELIEPCPNSSVAVGAVYEIDETGKEVPGTREEFA